jgi:hypothetical protein
LIKENNNYQLWGSNDINKYSIQKISPHEVIMYQAEEEFENGLTDKLSRFFEIYNPNFGQGFNVTYNFDKIENELAYKLLTNKKFLNYEDLNKIQYKFELLSIQNKHSNLIVDIRSKLEQKMLEGEELNIVRRTIERLEQQNVAFLHQIFSSLEIILCNLRYSNTIENLTLALYCIKTQGTEKISHFLKETQPLNTIKLSFIVFFYELIEEQLFKFVQENITSEYRESLSDSNKNIINNYLKNSISHTNKKLPSIEQLSNAIQRFIIRCLVAALEPKFPIKEYLIRSDFWDLNVNEDNIL